MVEGFHVFGFGSIEVMSHDFLSDESLGHTRRVITHNLREGRGWGHEAGVGIDHSAHSIP